IGKPIIFVSTNYRVNTFGFLASAHQPPEDLNAGLQDQRMALNFLQDNIAAFGGDPNKASRNCTSCCYPANQLNIGHDMGSTGSVAAHFIYPSDRHLFRAGIANSDTGPFKSSPPASTYDRPGLPFNRLITRTGCANAPDPVDCLRAVPFETLLGISNAMISATFNDQLWQPAIGPPGGIVTEEASDKIQRGDFLHLPFLAGTTVNEGNSFVTSLRNQGLTGRAQATAFDTFVRELVIDNTTITQDVLDRFKEFFPENDPTLGAPFNTGDSLFDRAAAYYTDQMFLSPRRLTFQHGSALQPMFAYYFREFIPGNNPILGVAHASELPLIFGPVPAVAAVEKDFANQLRDFWITFVNDLNPGGGWPRYDNRNKRVMQLKRDNITVIPDDWDVDKIDFIDTERVLREFQK
ncbi:Lipase 2, partial [Leucoagaricus sp. SymC.cos]